MRDELKKAMEDMEMDKKNDRRKAALAQAKERALAEIKEADSFVLITVDDQGEKSCVTVASAISGFGHFMHLFKGIKKWTEETFDGLKGEE